MKLEYIRFVFENCDSITIKGKHIGSFLVDDLHTYFARVACNSFEKIECADTFVVEIHRNANKERNCFKEFGCKFSDKEMIFHRMIEQRDLVGIEFRLVDGLSFPSEIKNKYMLYWEGEDASNKAQKTYISQEGHLYIIVSKEKDIGDFFDLNNINNSEYMKKCFELCNVG